METKKEVEIKRFENLNEIFNIVIDLIFEKYTETEELSYYEERDIITDVEKMKKELKEKLFKIKGCFYE